MGWNSVTRKDLYTVGVVGVPCVGVCIIMYIWYVEMRLKVVGRMMYKYDCSALLRVTVMDEKPRRICASGIMWWDGITLQACNRGAGNQSGKVVCCCFERKFTGP